ncbi:hypothetical protein BVJ60_18685, partial [Vibrio cholerae]|nr:hypothetical protein [Vibrio cholerae]
NARLRGWQRITPNSNTTTVTTAADWDWKRHALTVPLEAFVSCYKPNVPRINNITNTKIMKVDK